MAVLNNLAQAFSIYWMPNTFYPATNTTWLPVLKRMGLPYMNLEDFMNAQIQSFDFVGLDNNPKTQQLGLYEVGKRRGYAADMLMNKTFTLTYKLTESYISYFIAYQNFAEYLSIAELHDLYYPPIIVDLLDDAGFATISYELDQLTPTSLSNISLSYAARLGTYNTFTQSFRFNYFSIYYRDESGRRTLLSTDSITKEEKHENLGNDLLNGKLKKFTKN